MPDTGTPPNQTFSRSDGIRSGTSVFQQEAAAATGIQAALMDTHDNDIVTALNNRLMKNGGNQATANLQLGGFNLTNVGAGTAGNQVPNLAQVQNNALIWGGTAGGTANALTFTLTPALTVYVTGQRFEFIGGASANTGAATGNFGPSAPTFKKQGNGKTLADLEADDIMPGIRYVCAYDGTFLQLENPSGVLIGGSPENDTTEREYQRITSGSGAGATYSRRLLGSGANAVATLREYINNVKVLEWTSSLVTIAQAALFGSYADFTEISTPAAPAAGVLRLYSKSGDKLAVQNSSGAESIVSPLALAAAQGLSITNNGTTPNTKINASATQAILTTSAGVPIFISGPSVTIDLTVNGANGLDTGSKANSTWYHVYLISNGATTAGLASLSSTSPTLPSGYTYFMRVGAMQTDGSGNLYRTIQKGNKASYVITSTTNTASFPFATVNSSTSSSWTAKQATGNGFAAPATATRVDGILQKTNVTDLIGLAPNANYTNVATGKQDANPFAIGGADSGVSFGLAATFDFVLESNSIYYFSSLAGSGEGFEFTGWTDSVNCS